VKAPKRGKKYKEVIDRGCGGYQDHEGDYACEHGYEWSCDNCPLVIEKYKDYEVNKSLKGIIHD